MEKKFGMLSSSMNGEQLSLTVVSFVKGAIAILVASGVITVTGADAILEQVPVLVTVGYATYQSCLMLWGAARKVIVILLAR